MHIESQTANDRRLADSEAAHQRRNSDVIGHLDQLKKPHWSVIPNFWLTVLAVIAAVAGAIFAGLALLK